LGVTFTVHPSEVEELEDGVPEELALTNARRKADAVARAVAFGSEPAQRAGIRTAAGVESGPRVLGVDTVVALGGEVFGKPQDAAHACATLARLSGRTHRVISGLVLRPAGERVATTQVTFRALTTAQIERYVATGEWRGRAGGYAIQERGASLVERIEGDYLNVVGLPVAALLDLAPDLL
jgi:septum formation protein